MSSHMDTSFYKEPLIAALFDSPDRATRVVEQLIAHDFPMDQVSVPCWSPGRSSMPSPVRCSAPA